MLGAVARTATWRASAIAHVAMNTLASSALIFVVAPPKCLDPQPELAPEVRVAAERTASVISAPDRDGIEALLTPRYLERRADSLWAARAPVFADSTR